MVGFKHLEDYSLPGLNFLIFLNFIGTNTWILPIGLANDWLKQWLKQYQTSIAQMAQRYPVISWICCFSGRNGTRWSRMAWCLLWHSPCPMRHPYHEDPWGTKHHLPFIYQSYYTSKIFQVHLWETSAIYGKIWQVSCCSRCCFIWPRNTSAKTGESGYFCWNVSRSRSTRRLLSAVLCLLFQKAWL